MYWKLGKELLQLHSLAWSICHMGKGWWSWDCSAWRRLRGLRARLCSVVPSDRARDNGPKLRHRKSVIHWLWQEPGAVPLQALALDLPSWQCLGQDWAFAIICEGSAWGFSCSHHILKVLIIILSQIITVTFISVWSMRKGLCWAYSLLYICTDAHVYIFVSRVDFWYYYNTKPLYCSNFIIFSECFLCPSSDL